MGELNRDSIDRQFLVKQGNNKEKEINMNLSNEEKETIITFDETPADAVIFTYNRRWQTHLEKKLGLKPTMDNGFGGKEYTLPKSRIKPPRAPRKLSDTTKKKLAERLHRNRFLGAQDLVPVGK